MVGSADPRMPISAEPVRTSASTSSGVKAASAFTVTSGWAREKRGEDRGQWFHAGRGHGDQVDPAAAQSFECPHGRFGLVEIAQHHSGRPDQCGTGFAEDDAAADAVKQRHPEFALEAGDCLRQ